MHLARRWWRCGSADCGGHPGRVSARTGGGRSTVRDRARLCAAGEATGAAGTDMKRDVIGLRASSDMRSLIASYGTLSAAAQALMLIGAAEMGADLTSLRDDLMRLLWAGELAPELREQIRKMLNTPLTERLTIFGSTL